MNVYETFRNKFLRPGLWLGLSSALLVGANAVPAQAGAFGAGNVVVETMLGTTSANTAVAVNEYNANTAAQSAPVQTITLPNAPTRPTSAPFNLTDSGSASSDGYLSRSTDGTTLVLSGYNGITGDAVASSTAATVNRVIGTIGASGVPDTSRAYSNVNSANNFRSAASTNGIDCWSAGGNGFYYLNASTATLLGAGNGRVANIFNAQLYISSSSTTFNGAGSLLGIYQIGTGLPTSGTPTLTNLVNTGTGSSPYDYAISPDGKTVYIADDRATVAGGIQKWTSATGAAGSFTLAYTLGTGVTNIGARGLDVDFSGASAVLYATTAESSADRLIKITDTGVGATATTLATAGAGTVFRGVALAPASAGGNTAPVAIADSKTTAEDMALTFNASDLTANDTDAEGNTLTVTAVTATASTHGTVSLTSGIVSYAPTADYNGAASFTYTISDGNGGTATGTVNVTISAVNDAPVITSDGGGATGSKSAAENTTAVTTVTATDVDSSNLTYSISGADAAQFSINGTSGVLSFNPAPNFEAPTDADSNNVYEVTVQVSDDGTPILSDTQALSVSVTDVNEAPSVALANKINTLAEDADTTTATKVADIMVTDDALGTNTLSLTGADAANFEITAGALYLKAGTTLNYESKTSYDVTVNVDDATVGATPDDSAAFTLTITDVNDAPVITSDGGGATGSKSVAENTTAVTTVTATDVDTPAQTLSYSLGGADAAKFSIGATSGVLSFKTAPNFEVPTDAGTNNVYDVTVQVSDDGTPILSDTQDLSVTVTDVNEAPAVIALTPSSIAENSAAGTTVGTLSTTDPDTGDTFTYTFAAGGADNGSFTITGGTLKTAASFDFETKSSYSISVQSTDAGGLSVTQNLSITVTDVNEAPVITSNGGGATANKSVAENSTSVTTVTATDVDSTNLTYSLSGADAALFDIDATTHALTFKTAPDFETPGDADSNNVYEVTVQVSDDGTPILSDTQDLSVTVTDVNEAPTAIALSNNSIAENSAAGTTVGTLSTTDPDTGDTFVYTFAGGTNDASFTITGGTLKTAASFDFETKSSYNVRIRSTDQGTLFFEKDFTITVTDVNEAPVITSDGGGATANKSVAENTTAVTTVTATDVDSSNLTYSLGGADAAKFSIGATSGVLSFNTAPNFEAPTDADRNNVYEVTVQVSDDGTPILSDTQALSVTVTDVNEAPSVALANKVSTLAEDADTTTATKVADIVVTDDVLGTNTLSLTGTDAANFEITAGALYLKAGVALNYESKTTYDVTVNVDDATVGATPDDSAAFTLTITDVNEAPVITSDGGGATGSKSVAENTTAVTTVTATDVDTPAQTLSYSLGGADAAKFSIGVTSGVLSFKTAPNYAAPGDADADNVYEVTVQVSDGGTPILSDTQTLSITVTNANEAPTAITLSNSSVAENSKANANIGVLNTADSDVGDTFTYTLPFGRGSNSLFQIAGDVLQAKANFDFEKKKSYGILVHVTDNGGLGFDKSFTITVTDTNDAPVLDNSGVPQLTVSAPGTSITALLTTGANGAPITDQDAGALQGIAVFAADEAQGVWQFTTDGGTTWTAIGSVRGTRARLLAADGTNTRLRFLPNPGAATSLPDILRFFAWDQSNPLSGDVNGALADASSALRGGKSAFSLNSESVSVLVPGQAAPQLSITSPTATMVPTAPIQATGTASSASGILKVRCLALYRTKEGANNPGYWNGSLTNPQFLSTNMVTSLPAAQTSDGYATWTQPLPQTAGPAPTPLLLPGQYRLRMEALDAYAQKTVQSVTFVINDGTPQLTITSPQAGGVYSSGSGTGNLSQVTGTASDSDGITGVTVYLYRKNTNGNTAGYWNGDVNNPVFTPTYDASVNEVAATDTATTDAAFSTWSLTLPPLAIGAYSLRATARDSIGNFNGASAGVTTNGASANGTSGGAAAPDPITGRVVTFSITAPPFSIIALPDEPSQ